MSAINMIMAKLREKILKGGHKEFIRALMFAEDMIERERLRTLSSLRGA